MKRHTVILSVAFTVFALASFSAYSQQDSPEQLPAADEISIYGEVQNVGQDSMSIQYYDYDSDEERSIEIATDAQTKIENVASLAGIKVSDWVDVTYTVKDAKNTARSVFVEKDEDIAAETTGAMDNGMYEE